MKGVPLRIEIGPKDVAKSQVVLVRRDTNKKEFVKLSQLDKKIKDIKAKFHFSKDKEFKF